MSNIEQNLQKILTSRYGKDVRQSIHDSIHDCYEDGKAGAMDLVAREQIANLVAMNNPTEGNSELQDIRVGFDGTTYDSAGDAVRGQITGINKAIIIQRKGINDGYDYKILFEYDEGGFMSTTGVNVESTTRIRTSEYYKPNVEENIPVIVNDGYQLFIQEFSYKEATNYYESTGNSNFGVWITKNTSVTFNPDYYYKIMIRKGVDEDVTDLLSMSDKVIFGEISELNYIPLVIKETLYINANGIYFPVEWEIGGMSGTSGTNVESTTRIRTKEWIRFDGASQVLIKFRIGQIYIIKRYNNGSNATIVTSWISAQEYTIDVENGYEYRIMFQYSGNADLSWKNYVHILYNKLELPNEYHAHTYNNRRTLSMKVVTMGDSMFLYGNNKDIYSWQSVMNDYFNFKEVISVGIGGSGFRWIESRKYDIPEEYKIGNNLPLEAGVNEMDHHNSAFCSWYRISKTIPNDSDLIIVGTGTNDFGPDDSEDDLSDMQFILGSEIDQEWKDSEHYSEFGGDYDITKRRGAMLSAIMKLQLQAPNAMIVFVNSPNTRLSNGTGKNSTSIDNINYQKPTLDAMEYIHKMWGIPLIDIFGTSGINPLNRAKYTLDQIHCNALGYSSMFANAVIAGLKPLLNNGI